MSISILSQPETHTPAYNDQYFVLSSTNSGQTNFKYICTVTVDGQSAISFPIDKHPTDSKGLFNPQQLAQAGVNTTLDTVIDALKPASNSIKSVYCQFAEQYGSTPVTQPVTASGIYYVWDAAYDAVDFPAFTFAAAGYANTLNKGVYVGGDTGSSISNKVLRGQHYWMYWHRAFGAVVFDRIQFVCYDSALSVIQTSTILNSYSAVGSTYERNLMYADVSAVGTALVLATTPGSCTRTNGALPMIPATTYLYSVTWIDSGSVQASDPYVVVIDSFCSRYTQYALHWKNQYGAMDTAVFNLLSRKNTSKSEAMYQKNPYTLNSSNNYTYKNSDAIEQSFSTELTNRITLNTDIVTDDYYAYLKDLVSSPYILLEDSSGNLFSMKSIDSNYEKRLRVNDGPFNFKIELEYQFKDLRQRG